MPLMNKNYVTPAWIDNAAPPINDDELNAMSQTLEGSQILVGNGAPTSSTPGKVGQRYADISTTPPTMYVASAGFPGQPIPKLGTYPSEEVLQSEGYLVAYYGDPKKEIRFCSDKNHDVITLVYNYRASDNRLFVLCATPIDESPIATQASYYDPYYNSVSPFYFSYTDRNRGLFYGYGGIANVPSSCVITAPVYQGLEAALDAAANPPVVWKQEADPNRNIAREYSTGSSYAAGDYCIHDGKLWRALEATSGAWDGSKWEQAKYADNLSGHVSDENNPHNVTAAQTGAVSPPVLATVQATTAAVRDYFAGEYFFYEGQLYEVKEAVAQGGNLFAETLYWNSDVTLLELDEWYPYEQLDGTVLPGRYRRIRAAETNPDISGRWFQWAERPGTTCWVVVIQNDSSNGKYYLDICEQGHEPPYADRIVTQWCIVAGQATDGWWWGELNNISMTKVAGSLPFYGSSEQMRNFVEHVLLSIPASVPAVLGNGVTALRPKTGTVTIGTFWSGSGPYSQTVTVTGAAVTAKSKIDLTPTAAQLETLAEDGVLSLTIENNGGTLTAWVVGTQPSAAMTVSCVVRETA